MTYSINMVNYILYTSGNLTKTRAQSEIGTVDIGADALSIALNSAKTAQVGIKSRVRFTW